MDISQCKQLLSRIKSLIEDESDWHSFNREIVEQCESRDPKSMLESILHEYELAQRKRLAKLEFETTEDK